jgi:hypothetical protein
MRSGRILAYQHLIIRPPTNVILAKARTHTVLNNFGNVLWAPAFARVTV